MSPLSRASVILVLLAASATPARAMWQSFVRTDDGSSTWLQGPFGADDAGNVWAGTFVREGGMDHVFGRAGVARFDGGVWAAVRVTPEGEFIGEVSCIHRDRLRRLWFSDGSGLYRVAQGAWTTYPMPQETWAGRVMAMADDRFGALWIAAEGGLLRFDGTSWRAFGPADGLPGGVPQAVAVDSTGGVWVGTTGGAARYDGSSWQVLPSISTFGVVGVFSIAVDHSGGVWFATDVGATVLAGGRWLDNYLTSNGLGSDVVRQIHVDRFGAVWVSAGGIYRFDGSSWTLVRAPTIPLEMLSGPFIGEDSSGNMWFSGVAEGTTTNEPGGVCRFDGAFTFPSSPPEVSGVASIHADRAGNEWFIVGAGRLVRRPPGSVRSFTAYSTASGLASDTVAAITETRDGGLWLRHSGASGVSRFDGAGWRVFRTGDGLASDLVYDIAADSAGGVWFITAGGVSHFDGTRWRTFTSSEGLLDDAAQQILVDHRGDAWALHPAGLSRFDGSGWTPYPLPAPDGTAATADGTRPGAILEDHRGHIWTSWSVLARFDGTNWSLPAGSGPVGFILEDPDGLIWVLPGGSGVRRFDGEAWRPFTPEEGSPVGDFITSMFMDGRGNVWTGASAYLPDMLSGISWFNGTRWHQLPGFATGYVFSEDGSGDIWHIGGGTGTTRLRPDLVPPRTFITQPPTALSANRIVTIQFDAESMPDPDIRFSWSFDGSPWSAASEGRSWTGQQLADGPHTFQVRARDGARNIDPEPPSVMFEVDATPPSPVISYPSFGGAVRDSLVVRGTAADPRLGGFQVRIRRAGASSWDPPVATTLASASAAVVNGALARFDTRTLADGEYELRLDVTDTLGLAGVASVIFTVDNRFPFAAQTSPALVSASAGGHVYTTTGNAQLFFPPHALARDAIVRLTAITPDSVPDGLPSGAVRVLPGFEIDLSGLPLGKPAVLTMSDNGVTSPGGGSALALHNQGPDGGWIRLGGTVDPATGSISAPVTTAGRYALFAGGTEGAGSLGLSRLSFTPRVFSPKGTFSSRDVAIGFTLGRAGSATVRVFNRAGRLVRELAPRYPLHSGANLVRWDGLDASGAIVEDGIYLVSVEALGEKRVQPLAIVR